MILRRFTKHITEQNWFAVGLDVIVVVVGIFLGMQVTNWNEMRLEEQKNKSYIERIREDLAENKKDFKQRKSYFNQVRIHSLAALKALDLPTNELGEQFLIDIYQTSQIMPRNFGRDTYDEILSIGALNSSDYSEIKKHLGNFYRSLGAQLTNIQADTPYRDLIRSIMPYYAQTSIRSVCNDITTTGKNGEPLLTLPTSCSLDLTSEEISAAVTVIKNIDILRSHTRRITQLDNILIGINLIIKRVDLMDAYLESVK